MTRIFNISLSLFGLMLISPILLIFILLIYFQDKSSPFYIAPRVGRNKKIFNIVKLRSMSINADKNGVNSTSINDNRITKLGHIIRKYKIDEFKEIINLLKDTESRNSSQEKRIYFKDNYENLLINEVEFIWNKIDKYNDWTFLNNKIAKIRKIGNLLGAKKLIDF